MAAPGGANQIARRVIHDLIEFNGETFVDGYMSSLKSQQITESRGFINRMCEEANMARNLVGQLNALVAEMEALEDQGSFNDSAIFIMQIMGAKLGRTLVKCLSVIVVRLSHHPTVAISLAALMDIELNGTAASKFFDPAYEGEACSTEGSCVLVVIFVASSSFGKEMLKELEDVPRVTDKMKLWFTRTHTEEQFFFAVIHDFCFELRVSLSQHRRLIAELEALGQREDALRDLEGLYMLLLKDVCSRL
ncbi:hypothetical protein Tco_1281423, partial [Tanacetum coccineum]